MRRRTLAAALAVVAVAVTLLGAVTAAADEETLARHRNLGKAFYENPATQYDAVGEFEKALKLAPSSARERVNYGLSLLRAGQPEKGISELEKAQKQDPSIPHTWFNLGIAYKRDSRYDEAVAQLEGMIERVPDEAISHYNLGVLYKLRRDEQKALHHFEKAARLDPNLAGARFQLATLYRQIDRADDARAAMSRFRELKARDAGAAVPEDLEWSYYSEIYEIVEAGSVEDRRPSAELRFTQATLAKGIDAATAGLTLADFDGDRETDLVAFSSSGVVIVPAGGEAITGALPGVGGVADVASADFDGDGKSDLAVVHDDGAAIYLRRGAGKPRFERLADSQRSGSFRRAVWLDYDHDYDLDLVILGRESALLRNDGDGSVSDATGDFPFVDAEAVAAAVLDVVADTQGHDLAVAYAGRAGVLYRDGLGGSYEAVPLAAIAADATQLIAADVDHDGWTDLVVAGDDAVTLLLNGHDGSLSAAGQAAAGAPIAWADLENRAVGELVAATAGGAAVFRNRGRGRLAAASRGGGLPDVAPGALVAADLDGDGLSDLAAVTAGGELVRLENRTAGENGWLRVALEGVKNPPQAPYAEIEVKAGTRYQKRLYHGTPLHFGLGSASSVDTVRITWPNGLIQNEAQQQPGQAVVYKEAQRLSGSCPMVFTWNGEGFEFITDVLGVAPLGASAGDGEYFPVDHDEYIQIAGGSLRPRAGRYEIRLTEELREIAYLDQARLLAVDRPAALDVFTNDKFKGPPFPDFRLYGVERRHHPVRAVDHRGADVRERLTALDKRYPDGFRRDYAGVAELHHLELDFGAVAVDGGAVLVLAGWVDWADGSTFIGASQGEGPGLVMPYLQARDAAGEWVTVIEDLGIPAGKPKTIAVPIEFPSAARELRIVTSLAVYWDEIFLGDDPEPPGSVRLTEVPRATAELRFRGFSRPVIHPRRLQPERFVYADVRPTSMWNPTPGLYTRYGDVEELLATIDDRMVIMGSGDELRLTFDATALAPPAQGFVRDFLLFVDGWAKDGDANTAHSQTVGPLPFHGMPQYPYGDSHRFPDGDAHRRYLENYNTRPALRLLRPLTEGAVAPTPSANAEE